MSAGLELEATAGHATTALRTAMAAFNPAPAVWSDTIPSGVSFPYVLFKYSTNADTSVTNGVIVVNLNSWLVKVVDRGESYDPLKLIYAACHAALHRVAGPVGADGQVLFGRRTSRVRYASLTDNVEYRHLGGMYLFTTQGA